MKNKTLLLLLSLLVGLELNAQQGNNNYEEGIAVYYADDLHGQATSYGEQYLREGFSAAHPFYPLGTMLRVTRLDNGQSVQVRVNDKMPPHSERRITLSSAAALQIGLLSAGKLRVRIERVSGGTGPTAYEAPNRKSYAAKGNITYRSPASVSKASDVVQTSGLLLAPGLSGYVIQLASYQEGTHAVSNANQLLQRGVQHVYIWQKDGKNRVVVARFNEKANAANYLSNLRKKYFLDGIIVQLK